MAIQWPLSPNRGELHGVHQLPRGAPCRLYQCKGKFHICPSIIFSAFFFFFFVKLVLETITKLVLSLRSSLLSCFQHSRTNHCLYICSSLRSFLIFSFSYFLQRCAVDDDDPTLRMSPSRSITSSKNIDGAIKQEAKPTLIHEEDNETANCRKLNQTIQSYYMRKQNARIYIPSAIVRNRETETLENWKLNC